jgi:hypothetical protein
MGDGITSLFDLFVVVVMIAGVPGVIFGAPIAVLVFLSERRKKILATSPNAKSFSAARPFPLLTAMFVLLAITLLIFLLMAAPFTF